MAHFGGRFPQLHSCHDAEAYLKPHTYRRQTFDERGEQGDSGGLASTGGKIQSNLLQLVSQSSATVLRLGAAVETNKWSELFDIKQHRRRARSFVRSRHVALIHGSVCPQDSAPKPAHDWFIRFCTVQPCVQHTVGPQVK